MTSVQLKEQSWQQNLFKKFTPSSSLAPPQSRPPVSIEAATNRMSRLLPSWPSSSMGSKDEDTADQPSDLSLTPVGSAL